MRDNSRFLIGIAVLSLIAGVMGFVAYFGTDLRLGGQAGFTCTSNTNLCPTGYIATCVTPMTGPEPVWTCNNGVAECKQADYPTGPVVCQPAGNAGAVLTGGTTITRNDSYTMPAGKTLYIRHPGLLYNDDHHNIWGFTAGGCAGARHGFFYTDQVNPGNGTVRYTPDVGFTGVDTCEYRIAPNNAMSLSLPATVTITVTPAASSSSSSSGGGSSVSSACAACASPCAGGLSAPTCVSCVQTTCGPGSVCFRSSSSSSTSSGLCGNGIVQGEACDDGNTISGDCCSSICSVENGCQCINPSSASSSSVSLSSPGGNCNLCPDNGPQFWNWNVPQGSFTNVSNPSGLNFSHLNGKSITMVGSGGSTTCQWEGYVITGSEVISMVLRVFDANGSKGIAMTIPGLTYWYTNFPGAITCSGNYTLDTDNIPVFMSVPPVQISTGAGTLSSQSSSAATNPSICFPTSSSSSSSSSTSSSVTHLACQNSQCVAVPGPGVNQCANNGECLTTQHLACVNNACVMVAGAGANLCTTNPNNCTQSHAACVGLTCQGVPGAGSNQCTTNANCLSSSSSSVPPCSNTILGHYDLHLLVFAIPGVDWHHDMTITSYNSATGAFAGTGYWVDGPSQTWNITGVVTGSSMTAHVVYTNEGLGYSMDFTASIGANGNLSGTVVDSLNRPGTFTATKMQPSNCPSSSSSSVCAACQQACQTAFASAASASSVQVAQTPSWFSRLISWVTGKPSADSMVAQLAGGSSSVSSCPAWPNFIQYQIPGNAYPYSREPYGIAVGPDGNIWFAEYADKIGRVTTSGTISEFSLPGNSGPFGITRGSDGNMWFTEMTSNMIGRITPSGTVTEFPIPTAAVAPGMIITGPDGSMWFQEKWKNQIGRITTAGVVTEYPLSGPDAVVGDITAGPDGNVWFTQQRPSKLVKIASDGTRTEYGDINLNLPVHITTGPDGKLWFTDHNMSNGQIRIATITTTGTFAWPGIMPTGEHPTDIITGPDGNVWTPTAGGAIVRFTPGGGQDAYRLIPPMGNNPTGVSGLRSIVLGPDGNFWITTQAGAGKFNPVPPACIFPSSSSVPPSSSSLQSTSVQSSSDDDPFDDSTCPPESAPAVTSYPTPVTEMSMRIITAGPDGNLWMASGERGAKIIRMTPNGSFTEFNAPDAQSMFHSITPGPDGNLWLTENDFLTGEGFITRVTTSGVTTRFPVPTTNFHPFGDTMSDIIAGPDGNLWFAESTGNKIGRITPSGVITQFPLAGVESRPHGIVAGPDGNVWFTEWTGNKIGKITPSGVISEYPLPTPQSMPERITRGPDGNLWFTMHNINSIGKITPSGTITVYPVLPPQSGAVTIISGNDGNLWLVHSSTLATISTSGVLTTYAGMNAGLGLVVGPDGYIWFTEGTPASPTQKTVKKLSPDVCSSSSSSTSGNSSSSASVHSSGGSSSLTCGQCIALYCPASSSSSSSSRSSSTSSSVTHLACVNSACVAVPGAGVNQCANNGECLITQHLACVNNACATVQGPGANLCTTNPNNCASSHLACVGLTCQGVPGAGPNQCATNANCGGSSSSMSSSLSPSSSSRSSSSLSPSSSSRSSSSSSNPGCSGLECILGANAYCNAQMLACNQTAVQPCFLCSGKCGNHALDAGEECDDGNTGDGDGCSKVCKLDECVISSSSSSQ